MREKYIWELPGDKPHAKCDLMSGIVSVCVFSDGSLALVEGRSKLPSLIWDNIIVTQVLVNRR